MSNNAPDYEDNLAFDPDALTMPRCDIERLEKQLAIAKDVLLKVANAPFNTDYTVNGYFILGQLSGQANEALRQIKELDE